MQQIYVSLIIELMNAFYPVVLTIHILSAIFWAALIPADIILRPIIFKDPSGKGIASSTVSAWLKFLNLTGMVGMTGVLVTGIILVLNSPYGFFHFADNHWLATKQVIMVVLLALTGAKIIPLGVKTRRLLDSRQDDIITFQDEALANIRSLARFATITGVLILLNMLLAVTHRWMAA